MNFKTHLLATVALGVAARAFADGTSKPDLANVLRQLDAKDDKHWTADGQPRIDVVKSLSGDQSITREAIDKAAPNFNRESARQAAAPPPPTGHDPMAAALADGWLVHPDAAGYHYRGQEVVADADLAARYPAQAAQSAPSGGGQTAEQGSDPAQDLSQDISQQTGMGGAMTARSPAPVEGELRKTHVSELSQGEPGERPIGVVRGMTDSGTNQLGTPPGTVENPARDIELSGEVQARSAGSVLTPSQAMADSSNAEGISLGGAADPVVEARAPGGAVVAEGAEPATFFEGKTKGGPFGHSGITAGDGTSQAQLGSVDVSFDGDPDAVAALEAELETASGRTANLRAQVDDLNNQLHESLRTEAQLRRQIEANQPRAGNMHTIQTFLRSSHQRRAARVRAEREGK